MRLLLRVVLLWLFVGPVVHLGQTKSGQTAQSPSAQAAKQTPPENPLVKALREGNQALADGHYDDAIAAYDRGIALDPTQDAFFLNKARALRLRGATTWNQSLKNRDQKTKDAIQRDWVAALAACSKALDIVETDSRAKPPVDPAQLGQRRLAALEEKAEILKLLLDIEPATDDARLHEAIAAFQAAADLTKDPVKKNRLLYREGMLLLGTADNPGRTLSVFKSILETEPENLDALYGAAMATLMLQDGKSCKEYGARFFKAAPAVDRRRAEIKEACDAIP